jgi:V/A-type H+-transporting ATPase subunit F
MKLFCISDNIDTRMGMRLTGVEGVVVHTRDEVLSALEQAYADPEIGIILITSKLIQMCYHEIYDRKLHQRLPLITEIPDRHGQTDISANIARYLNEAIGVSI